MGGDGASHRVVVEALLKAPVLIVKVALPGGGIVEESIEALFSIHSNSDTSSLLASPVPIVQVAAPTLVPVDIQDAFCCGRYETETFADRSSSFG